MIYKNKIFYTFLFLLLYTFNSSNVLSQKRNNNTRFTVEEDTKIIKSILKKIDSDITDTSIYASDLVHMAQGSTAIIGKSIYIPY